MNLQERLLAYYFEHDEPSVVQEACREMERLELSHAAQKAELEKQIQWWVQTAMIKGDQYRALLGWITNMHDAAERFAQSTDLALIETYVNHCVPTSSEIS